MNEIKLKYATLYSDYKQTKIKTWGRELIFKNTVLPFSIKSQNKEILAAPIRVVGVANNKEIIWQDEGSFYLADIKDDIIINGFAKSQFLILNTSYRVDESGTYTIDVKISPMGVSENVCFGVEEKPDPTRTIQKLYLEIPFKKEFNLFNFSDFPMGFALDKDNKQIFSSGKIPKGGVKTKFQPLVSLSNGNIGLSMASESDENWTYDDANSVIEIVEKEDAYILRFKLINKNPDSWTDDSLYWSPQICYRFFMTPTPIKEINKELLQERILHLGCFEHIKDEVDYYTFLNQKYNEKETNFEHIVNSKINTLILHERWNSMQNYWHYDQYTMDSLKALVKKCHQNNIKVLVYFGFEVTSITHDFFDIQKDTTYYPRENVLLCDWYREPYQRATPVCGKSYRRVEFIEGLLKTVDLFNLDGVYLDGTATPRGCCNTNHGCGYKGKDGKIHATYPISAVKENIKEICTKIHERGGRVDIHSSGLLIPYICYYADSIWEGENLQSLIRDSKDKTFIFDSLRTSLMGVNMQFIAFNLRQDWGIKQAQAYCLPCGIYTRANSIYQPLDVCKPINDMIDEFNIKEAIFVGFWDNKEILVDNKNIVISYYKKDNKYLVYVSNPTGDKQKAKFTKLPNDIVNEEIMEFDASEIKFFRF